ncbi:MAG TPA: hypothetical protein VGG32_08770 [Thermoplasmata archaeon]
MGVIAVIIVVLLAVVIDVETQRASPSPTPITASDGTVSRMLPWESALGINGGPSYVYQTINVTSSFVKNGTVGTSTFDMSVATWVNNEGSDGYLETFQIQVTGAISASVSPSSVDSAMNDLDSRTTNLTAGVSPVAGLNDTNVSSPYAAYASQWSNTWFHGLGKLSLQVDIVNESQAQESPTLDLFRFAVGLQLMVELSPQNQTVGNTYNISATLEGMSEPVYCLLEVQMPAL